MFSFDVIVVLCLRKADVMGYQNWGKPAPERFFRNFEKPIDKSFP